MSFLFSGAVVFFTKKMEIKQKDIPNNPFIQIPDVISRVQNIIEINTGEKITCFQRYYKTLNPVSAQEFLHLLEKVEAFQSAEKIPNYILPLKINRLQITSILKNMFFCQQKEYSFLHCWLHDSFVFLKCILNYFDRAFKDALQDFVVVRKIEVSSCGVEQNTILSEVPVNHQFHFVKASVENVLQNTKQLCSFSKLTDPKTFLNFYMKPELNIVLPILIQNENVMFKVEGVLLYNNLDFEQQGEIIWRNAIGTKMVPVISFANFDKLDIKCLLSICEGYTSLSCEIENDLQTEDETFLKLWIGCSKKKCTLKIFTNQNLVKAFHFKSFIDAITPKDIQLRHLEYLYKNCKDKPILFTNILSQIKQM